MEKIDNVEENSLGESSMIGSESLENVEKTGASSDERVLAEDAEIQVMCDLTPIQMGILGANKGVIDTAAPIDSVKDAVSKFGGIVDWKAHKVMAQEKHTHIQNELERALDDLPKYRKRAEEAESTKQRILSELDCTTKLVDELKASLERSRTEEAQARQDSELAQARAREMKQGISDGASAAAKVQLDVARARQVSAAEELESVAGELEGHRGDHRRLDDERGVAVARAEEAVSAARDAERKAEGLTVDLIAVREALEMAHASRLEAEERRIAVTMVRDQDVLVGERELSQANDEMKQLTDLKSKFEIASTTLLNLKTELSFYAEGGSNKAKKELEGMKAAIEKAKDGLNCLREAASSLRTELDRETETAAALQQRAEAVSSLEAELSRVQSEMELITVDDIPRLMQQATRDADRATSVARLAHEELERAREEAEQARAGAMAAEARLVAVLEEKESARASEALAVASMSKGVTLRLEEACKVLEEKKEALRVATEAAEREKEGMACAERELRELSDCRHLEKNPSESAAGGRGRGEPGRVPGFHGPSMSCLDLYDDPAVAEAKPRKKKPFFPRVVMFLARKKSQSPK